MASTQWLVQTLKRPSRVGEQPRNTTNRNEVEGSPISIDQKYTWRHDARKEMGHEESVRKLDSSERKEMPTGVL